VVGAIVRDLVARDQDFQALTLEEWQAYHELFASDVMTEISGRGSVEARRTPQSTHPDSVAAALNDVTTWAVAHLPPADSSQKD
jgi:argininosuccinate lyase